MCRPMRSETICCACSHECLDERGSKLRAEQATRLQHRAEGKYSLGSKCFKANQTSDVRPNDCPTACNNCEGRKSVPTQSWVSWPAMKQPQPTSAKPNAMVNLASTKRRIVATVGAVRNCGSAIHFKTPPISIAR